MPTGRTREEMYTNNADVDKEFISWDQNGFWPVIVSNIRWNGPPSQTMCIWAPRIPVPLKDVKHVARCHRNRFNGIPQPVPRVTPLCVNGAHQMAVQVEVGWSRRPQNWSVSSWLAAVWIPRDIARRMAGVPSCSTHTACRVASSCPIGGPDSRGSSS